jgi:hypothetical protein
LPARSESTSPSSSSLLPRSSPLASISIHSSLF